MEESCCKLADYRGWTALHSAAQYGHLDVAAELIKVGDADDYTILSGSQVSLQQLFLGFTNSIVSKWASDACMYAVQCTEMLWHCGRLHLTS